jgi:hypothetical protein
MLKDAEEVQRKLEIEQGTMYCNRKEDAEKSEGEEDSMEYDGWYIVDFNLILQLNSVFKVHVCRPRLNHEEYGTIQAAVPGRSPLRKQAPGAKWESLAEYCLCLSPDLGPADLHFR